MKPDSITVEEFLINKTFRSKLMQANKNKYQSETLPALLDVIVYRLELLEETKGDK